MHLSSRGSDYSYGIVFVLTQQLTKVPMTSVKQGFDIVQHSTVKSASGFEIPRDAVVTVSLFLLHPNDGWKFC